MEIIPKMVTCPNGHYYNANKHSSCPTCAAEASSGGQGTFSPTIPLGAEAADVQGSFPKTISPGEAAVPSGSFGQTMPVEPQAPFSPASPFDVPTSIGGDLADSAAPSPVVGWLVCIEGPVRGADYRIHAGYNYIGRDSGDIRIRGDAQISRQNHAMIAFDESDCSYFVGPSAGRNLIKVNGKTVLNAVQIQNYDVISIGSTKLIFVALCGEAFTWHEENAHEV